MNILYIAVIEIIIAILLAIMIIVKSSKMGTKKTIIFSVIVAIVLVVALILTFALEMPKIEFGEFQVEVKSVERTEVPKTTYMLMDITDKVKIVGDIDYNKVGKYEITYQIPTLFKTYKIQKTINVVDTIKPEIKLESGDVIKQSYSKEYEELGYSAKDNYDGDITSKVQVEQSRLNDNELEIKYTVTDASGNISKKSRKVILIDDVPPVMALNGKENITQTIGTKYQEQGAKAIDEKDGDLSSNIEITGSVDTSKAGTYQIKYKVSDKSGNIAEKTRIVTITRKATSVKGANPTRNKRSSISNL